jgi:hypothetical protein
MLLPLHLLVLASISHAETPARPPTPIGPAQLVCPEGWALSARGEPVVLAVECGQDVLTSCSAVAERALAETATTHFVAEQQSMTAQGVGPKAILEQGLLPGSVHRGLISRSPHEGKVYRLAIYSLVVGAEAVVVSCSARDDATFDTLLPTFDALGASLQPRG